jgi:hypothetical protein
MPESYREYPEDRSRIERLRNEVETLRAQLAQIQRIHRMQKSSNGSVH